MKAIEEICTTIKAHGEGPFNSLFASVACSAVHHHLKDKIILSSEEMEEIVEQAVMLGMATMCPPTDEAVKKGVKYVMDSVDPPAKMAR